MNNLPSVLSIVIIILLIIIAGLFYYFNWYEPNIIFLENSIEKRMLFDCIVDGVNKFEEEMNHSYPLGDKTFCIQHPKGWDYFNFFADLGSKFKYAIYWEDGRVWATGCAVLREIDLVSTSQMSWYICDLKVHPSKRGQHIPYRMFCKGIFPAYTDCCSGYGVTMLPPEKPENAGQLDRVSHIAQHSGF